MSLAVRLVYSLVIAALFVIVQVANARLHAVFDQQAPTLQGADNSNKEEETSRTASLSDARDSTGEDDLLLDRRSSKLLPDNFLHTGLSRRDAELMLLTVGQSCTSVCVRLM